MALESEPALARTHAMYAVDGYIRLAVLSSLGQGAGEALSLLADDAEFRDSKEGREMLSSLTSQIGKQQRPDDIALTLTTLAALAKLNSPVLPTIVQRLA